MLLCVNVFLIVNTELALKENRELLGDEKDPWTFGQVLVVMLLIVPVCNFIDILLERRRERQETIRNLVSKSANGDLYHTRKLLDEERGDSVKGRD